MHLAIPPNVLQLPAAALALLGGADVLHPRSCWMLGSPAQGQLRNPHAAPRTITPRGGLNAEERATIALFRQASPSVVYITTLARQRDFFSLNIAEIPQGSGSGFIWDQEGHIITNFHVIQGASGAKVTLADHSVWDAQLVGDGA